MQARQNLSHAMTYASGILNPLMFLAILVLPRTEPLTGAETTQVLTGTTLAAFWAASVWGGVGVLRRERWGGTLARSVTGVQDARWVLLGKVAGAGSLNLAVVLTSLASGRCCSGCTRRSSTRSPWPWGLWPPWCPVRRPHSWSGR